VRIGVVTNPHYPQTWELAEKIAAALGRRGAEVVYGTARLQEAEAPLSDDVEMLITLGGDGTMLRAAHLVAAWGTPILGIHMGRLGFLAEVRSKEWEQSLDRLLAGHHVCVGRQELRALRIEGSHTCRIASIKGSHKFHVGRCNRGANSG